jgi:predicted ArsR family transcriptional regulator
MSQTFSEYTNRLMLAMHLLAHHPKRATELAKALKVSESTALRILKRLRDQPFVRLNETHRRQPNGRIMVYYSLEQRS